MKATGLSDLAHTFVLQRRSTELREQMTQLSQEVTTGVVSDVSGKLGGDFARLSGIEHRLSVMSGLRLANDESAGFVNAAQLRLGQMAETTGELGRSLLSLGAAPVLDVVQSGSERAVKAFEDAVHQLGGFHAGRALFSGLATDTSPLVGAETILNKIRSVAASAGTAAAAMTAIETWFTDPTGFESFAYQGATENLRPLTIDEGRTVGYNLRADNPEIRAMLRDMSAAALASDPALALSLSEQGDLLAKAGEGLVEGQDAMINLGADLGVTQELIEQASVRQSTERLILEQSRASLIAADPYQAATELEAVQFQLESLYTITVRTSQLSLVNFLR